MNGTVSEDILWRHLRDLPYFRAMVRAVEDRFYQGLELPVPVLDLGCGDGHFASVAFDHPLDVGLDPWWGPLLEARSRNAYRMLVRSDGAKIPFPDGHFASVVSNSVLEHIPHLDEVLSEVARVIRPDGRFVFCVPNHRFPALLLGTQTFRRFGLTGAADWYSRFFNRISRHQHTDSFEVWQERMDRTGFTIEQHWDYFPADALHRMEVGHALGVPALVSKKLTGRWILAPGKASLWVPWQIARGVFLKPISPEGVYSFYITRRNG
ncbi:MAG: class I SAM-dependent methyltransferase [Chloroflexi bacterium]|nr:MAG: class I SAM-dependent methyltransferase [Chloroflexota bacterium]